ncbi:glutathione S-transferase family protein [Sulfitobacter sp.]|uniref:glutathione S-transferase family protein n=1 Tax=Sulfitobacter sp. TaxID=1903071 RepID=UPI003EF56A61
MTNFVLYGSQASLFTGKVRGYMNWKGLTYEEKAVDETIMKTVILPHVGWPVIPVLQTPDGRVVQDTADIIAEIEATYPEPSVMPAGPVQRFASLLMQVFADQWLLLPAMHYRWNYNEDWISTEFGRSTAPDASATEQHAIGKKRGEKFRAMVPLLGIDEATIPGIESSYEQFLSEFSTHLEQHDYVFGSRPSFADFSLLGPLYAHLYRDPASREVMERVAPRVARWTERTISGEDRDGYLIGNDTIPETLEPLFRRHSAEHLPVLAAVNTLFDQWSATASSGDELPRSFGRVPFTAGGSEGQTLALSFSLFRLQAALDALQGLSDSDRANAEGFLKRINAEELLSFKIGKLLVRKNCKLCLA